MIWTKYAKRNKKESIKKLQYMSSNMRAFNKNLTTNVTPQQEIE